MGLLTPSTANWSAVPPEKPLELNGLDIVSVLATLSVAQVAPASRPPETVATVHEEASESAAGTVMTICDAAATACTGVKSKRSLLAC